MIGTKILDQKYINWNQKWGAPYGYELSPYPGFIKLRALFELLKEKSFLAKSNFLMSKLGVFNFQPNSTTRIFEYPWAFYATDLKPGLKVLDVGGGLSGFQFILSKSGLIVTNVDPSDPEFSWKYNESQFKKLNNILKTNVRLIQKTMDHAELENNSFDRIFCISTFEHLQPLERELIVKEVYRILKKGGFFILTVDLFLDIYPFSDIKTNQWGSNMNIAEFIQNSRFTLVQGKKDELFGFPEFKVKNIMANLRNYLMGATYPVLTQVFVLYKS